MTAIQRKKLKLLCLHGGGTNKQFIKIQTSVMQKDLSQLAQFIFVDAPYIIPNGFIMDPKVKKLLQKPPRSWFRFNLLHKTNQISDITQNLNQIIQNIESTSSDYDGAMCFSQGSFAFQLLLWFKMMGKIKCKFLQNIKFFINLSAQSYRISLKDMKYQRFTLPSLHFLSQYDFVFSKCIITPTFYQNSEIIFHSFGHRFPILGQKQKIKLRKFIKKYGYNQQEKITQLSSL